MDEIHMYFFTWNTSDGYDLALFFADLIHITDNSPSKNVSRGLSENHRFFVR